MALREILTHHGGSAGLAVPDLSLDGALDELREREYSNAIKREREIDLNLQVLTDEYEPNPKRHKSEDLSSQTMDMMVSTSNLSSSDICVKLEHSGWNLPVRQVNSQADVVSCVKMEPESYPNVASYSAERAVGMVESKGSPEHQGSFMKSNLQNSSPENCDLMNLVKLARHSSIKNNEFLQDCAIRFLCILSLDR
jgi:TATA-binding protein-associated factor